MKRIGSIVILALLFLFIGVIAILLILNIDFYKTIDMMEEDILLTRTPIAYIENKVREMDCVGSVWLQKIEDTDVLVFKYTQENVPYETWIYGYNGSLCEIDQKSNMTYKLESGEKICDINSLKMAIVSPNLLNIHLKESTGKQRHYVIVVKSTLKEVAYEP